MTYFLHVYDANTRMLVGTTTSRTPELIFNSLPRNHNGLQLFVRTINSQSIASDAAVLFVTAADFSVRSGGKIFTSTRWWE